MDGLAQAIANNQGGDLETLLESGVDPNLPVDESGSTALHLAAGQGRTRMVSILLTAGAYAHLADQEDGFLPLHLAAQGGHVDTVKLLAVFMEDIDAVDGSERTSLLYAAKGGHLDTCIALLECNADIDASDVDGWTPLHVAAREGHTKVVNLLLGSGCKLTEVEFELGASCLHLAAEGGHSEVVQLLLQRPQSRDEECPLSAMQDDDGWSALEVAQHHDHRATVAAWKNVPTTQTAGGGGASPTTAKSTPTPGPVSCPNGHTTVVVWKRYLAWGCDRCDNDYDPAQRAKDDSDVDGDEEKGDGATTVIGMRSARCHPCDFDLCEDCWSKSAEKDDEDADDE